jgi:hypothetical protein
MIFLHQNHERREAACRVASLGDRIDDIAGLHIKVSDYLQHYKSGYLYIYRCAKWIAKLQSFRWGILRGLLGRIKGQCAIQPQEVLRLQGLNPFGT